MEKGYYNGTNGMPGVYINGFDTNNDMEKKGFDSDTESQISKRSLEGSVVVIAEKDTAEIEDPWALPELEDTGPKFAELDRNGKIKYVIILIVKIILLLAFLYLFICSLDFLSSSFRLVGGRLAGEALGQSELMQNPIAGLMIGILATVLVQSSSTSTSITVSMVASGILPVKLAIPIVMGANVGTAITGIIVAMAQSGDRNQFRRAFGAASVHNMAAWLTVLVILPIEIASNYLFHLSSIVVDTIDLGTGTEEVEFLKVITKPFTELIIQVDSDVIREIAEDTADGTNKAEGKSIIKHWCEKTKILANITETKSTIWTNITSCSEVSLPYGCENSEKGFVISWNETGLGYLTVPITKCTHLFVDTTLDDASAGIILLLLSLVLLCGCLVVIVKIIHSLLKGKLAAILKKVVNSDFPGCCRHFTGYAVIVFAAGLTTLLQSSSIFISTLTPLAGVGVVSIERMLPLAFGSKIGTTFTSMLAALASDADGFKPSFQVALCHLFFNFSGILVFYVIPPMRKIPIKLAMTLGDTTAVYRWFAVVFVLLTFILLPLLVFALSLAGWYVLAGVGIPLLLLCIFVIVVNILQDKFPHKLPKILQNWNFLPLFLRSLEPYDRVFRKMPNKCRRGWPNVPVEGELEVEPKKDIKNIPDGLKIPPMNGVKEKEINSNEGPCPKEVHVNNAFENTAL